MLKCIKKKKNIILSSSIFNGISSNIYCECCKCKKCGREKIKTISENNTSTINTENPDPQKDQNPKKNPPKPGENPQKTPFELKKQNLLNKIEDLKKLCPGCNGMSRKTDDGKTVPNGQIYSEELNKIQKDINSLVDNGNKNIMSLNNIGYEINSVETNIKTTLNCLLGHKNTSKLIDLLKKVKLGIKDQSKKKKFEQEVDALDKENKDINNAEKVKDLIIELEKKIEDQLNKEDSGRKTREDKRTNVLQLLKDLEGLKLNILETIDFGVTEKQITDAKTIEELNNIENNLINKENEIKKIIDDQNKICIDQNEFITEFNKRKNILAEKFNNTLKTKLKDVKNNLKVENIGDYYSMYQDMISDVFNHQIALDLQIYRYILNLEGFITALDNIFKKKIQYWFLYLFDKSNANTCEYSVIKIKEDTYKIGLSLDKKDCLKVETGDFCVENEKFKYVRCKEGGCNDDNCVSCKLRKLLTDDGILGDFINIYKQQGNSSSSSEAMLMKRIIYDGLKKDNQKLDYYYSTIKESKLDEFKKDVDHKFIKCVMIEWALTIEFMKRFIPKYYDGSTDFYLYRTFGPGNNNFIELNEITHDLYESTCLIAPAFISCYNDIKTHINKVKLCSFTKTKNHVKYYRCFFNHIISPKDECILKGDYEHEIGFIGINEKYERISDKSGDEYIKKYNNFLKNATFSNAKKNLPSGANILGSNEKEL